MWTPRRILLYLLGIAGFVAVYFVYTRMLGSVDGLPDLPATYLVVDSGQEPDRIDNPVSPTLIQLERAFGPNSPEVIDQTAYSLRLALREKGLVFACGSPQISAEPSRFVVVSPFSVAFFGKPRPPHLRQPNEEDEITTFHADRAVLEFDKSIRSLQDIDSKAHMVGMELVSVPDMPSVDKRRGRIVVTSNQRSADPWQFVVFQTTGPLYYRAYDEANPAPADAPQVWTTAAVEVVDRRNLPRPLQTVETVPSTGDELRKPGTISAILSGQTLPPPTVTADGMKIYLQPQDPKGPGAKRNATGYEGVRLVELTEKVRFCQWGDGRSALGPAGATGPVATPPPADPPLAAGALAGAAFDAAILTRKLETRTLLVIETLGSFRYDFHKNLARFEAAAIANPALDNHVAVSRLSASSKQDNLFCSLMMVEFTGSPDVPVGGITKAPTSRSPTESRRIKSLTATGPHVYVAIESEQLKAQGTELVYTADPKARQTFTVLRGNPVTAVREKNRLEGGNRSSPGEVVITATDPDPAAKGTKKQTTVLVRGPGRIQMIEDGTDATTFEARWGRSLTHERVLVGTAEQDLLKFDGGGTFIDTKGDMKLTADLLKLWVASGGEKKGSEGKSKSLPQQVVAIGKVESDSPDLLIRNTDQLTVWFRDIPPPKELEPAKRPPPPMAFVGPPTPTGPPPLASKPDDKKPDPKKAKSPPVQLSARVIESWMTRYAKPPVTGKAPADSADDPGQKYELERARCEDRVVVHQDAADPGKNPYGLDITGLKLNVESSRLGSVMTVIGTPQTWAQVHFEGMSLLGPAVVIDQPNNAASVDGRGVLVMPSENTDPATERTSKPAELEIHWATAMRFEGSKARAEFRGQVHASQQPPRDSRGQRKPEAAPTPRVQPAGYHQTVQRTDGTPGLPTPVDDGSWTRKRLVCHRLDVTFDRPVYFNNFRQSTLPVAAKTAEPVKKPDAGRARLETALCIPMPDDELGKLEPEKQLALRWVTYLEETLSSDGKIVRAQRIDGPELQVRSAERKQEVFAAGPGEVRILQLGSRDGGFNEPGRPATGTGRLTKKDDQELKLTFVEYTSRMLAEEKGRTYQQATFIDGARVWHIPTNDLHLAFVKHAPPHGTVFLACTESLKVSSDRKKPGETEQWMQAEGNAEFLTDEYIGSAGRITYDGKAVVFEAQKGRLARLYGRRVGVNNTKNWNAERILYFKDGTVRTTGNSSGTIIPGQ